MALRLGRRSWKRQLLPLNPVSPRALLSRVAEPPERGHRVDWAGVREADTTHGSRLLARHGAGRCDTSPPINQLELVAPLPRLHEK